MLKTERHWKVQIVSPSSGKREFTLPRDGATVGRAPDNDLRIDEKEVSRYHARFCCDPFKCSITDLGSANGTEVNGVKLAIKSSRELSEGDVITIGQVEIVLSREGASEEVYTGESEEETAHVAALPDVPRLFVTTSNWQRSFLLDREKTTIGRATDNDIVIPEGEISAYHSQVRLTNDVFELVDLESTNGVFIDGKRIVSKILSDGDLFKLGPKVTVEFKEATGVPRFATGSPIQESRLALRGKTAHTIGRHKTNDTVIKHPSVSRYHAKLNCEGDTYYIEDLGSINGTFVNGERIEERVRLAEGDTILIHPCRFTFSAEGIHRQEEGGNIRLDAFHLEKTVGPEIRILQDISLSIQPGEFVAVVGASGCGKSTLLDALSGLRPATGGTVFLNEDDLYRQFDTFRDLIGYVPQDDIIHLRLKVYKALDYAAQLYLPPDTTKEERRQRIEEVLRQLGLWDRRNTPVKNLSGGQRKRVSIGVELLTDPSLFFLDEPTSGLDPGMETKMMQLMRELADNETTVIVTTHRTQNIMMCDKVVFLASGGRLVYFGKPEDALDFFKVEEFVDIYDKLELPNAPEEWHRKYKASVYFKKFVVDPLRERKEWSQAESKPVQPQQRPGATVKKVSGLRQFFVLSRRYLDLTIADTANTFVMLAQAPVSGLLVCFLFARDIFDPTPLIEGGVGNGRLALVMVYNLTLLTCYFGLSNAAKEIVKEAAIYRRERLVNLRILPYILSKYLVLLLLCFLQCASLLGVVVLGIDFPDGGATMHLQMLITLVLTGMTGTALGLAVSAIVRTEDTAVSLVPILLVPNLMFAGTIVSFLNMDAIAKLVSMISISKWAMEVLGAIVDLNGLFVKQGAYMLQLKEDHGPAFDVDVGVYWGVLGVFILVPFFATYIAQWRKDSL